MNVTLLVTHYYDETGHSSEIDSAYLSEDAANQERDKRNEAHKKRKDFCQDYSTVTLEVVDALEAAEARAAALEKQLEAVTAERDELKDERNALSMFGSASKCRQCGHYYPSGYVCGRCGRDNSYSDEEWNARK